MKIALFTDLHWSTYSSIIRNRKENYSLRLHNLINSLNWFEELSIKEKCDKIICLGDFFDRPNLSDEEITALRDVTWNENISHLFLVGNHESSVNGLRYNSVKSLEKSNFEIINTCSEEDYNGFSFIFLPYMLEEDRKDIKSYTSHVPEGNKKIIFSHNDIAGIQYGAFESKEGFKVEDIDLNCDLFLNGHLHNKSWISKKILNLGNLTGQNFSEDAFKYNHCAAILDTDTLNITFYENPKAFNFYKLEINKKEDLSLLDTLKQNSVLSIKCEESILTDLKNKLNMLDNIVESRIITFVNQIENSEEIVLELNTKDYLEQFSEFIIERLGKDPVVIQELQEVCK